MILINKSASEAVLKGVYNLLDTGQSIPVYDHVPTDKELPFIVIDTVSENEFSTKTLFGSKVELAITNYAFGLESKTVQGVTNSLIGLLDESDLQVEGFNVIGIELVRNECAQADVDSVYYGTLAISVWVEESVDDGSGNDVLENSNSDNGSGDNSTSSDG